MQFKLKDNKKFILQKGRPEVISNVTMTKKLALEFLSKNTESRKQLFEWLPEDIDEMLNPKPKPRKKATK